MTWEQTINYIRQQPEFYDLVKQTYFEVDLNANVEAFKNSLEFKETLALINFHAPNAKNLLDVGSGNGISAISFALKGYNLSVVEPDPSETVGTGAIKQLVKAYGVSTIDIHQEFAEKIDFSDAQFDVVYARQAMHHALELEKFVSECARVLKPGGILITIRDHVIYDEDDKQRFLNAHPLHKLYGGENAFTSREYRSAMHNAGLSIMQELRFYDSPINYYPLTKQNLLTSVNENLMRLRASLRKKLGLLANFPFVFKLYKWKNRGSFLLDEKIQPGRMYSYVAKKT